jgi:two-component system cell cycle response regulator CtrA
VTINDAQPHLTTHEYLILEALATGNGRTQSKEMLLDHLYAGRDEPELKIIDVFVCKLRKKLADMHGGAGEFIETVWGRGYRLKSNVMPPETAAAHPVAA